MHPSMTSPFYPAVLVVWGSSVAFCYKCLPVFLSFCSTDGKVDITKGFVGCSEPLLSLLMLWQLSRCCPTVRDPKWRLAYVVMATFSWSVNRIHFIFDHQPPPASVDETTLLPLWLISANWTCLFMTSLVWISTIYPECHCLCAGCLLACR